MFMLITIGPYKSQPISQTRALAFYGCFDDCHYVFDCNCSKNPIAPILNPTASSLNLNSNGTSACAAFTLINFTFPSSSSASSSLLHRTTPGVLNPAPSSSRTICLPVSSAC